MVLLDRVRRLTRAAEVVDRRLTCTHSGEPAMDISSESEETRGRDPYRRSHCEDCMGENATRRECGEPATATGDDEGSRRRTNLNFDGQQALAVCAFASRFLLATSTESYLPDWTIDCYLCT
jgi:hypothetical protein